MKAAAGLGEYPLAVMPGGVALQTGCGELLKRYAVHLIVADIIVLQQTGVASRQRYAPLAGGGRICQKGAVMGFAEEDAILAAIICAAVLNAAEPAAMQGYAPLTGPGITLNQSQPLRSVSSKSLC